MPQTVANKPSLTRIIFSDPLQLSDHKLPRRAQFTVAKQQSDVWPHRETQLTRAEAAKLIGVSRDTLRRIVRALLKKEPLSRVQNRNAVDVGRLYIGPAGTEHKTALADQIYKVLGVDPKKMAKPPPIPPPLSKKRSRNRSIPPSKSTLANLPEIALHKALSSVLEGSSKELQKVLTSTGKRPSKKAKTIWSSTIEIARSRPKRSAGGRAGGRIFGAAYQEILAELAKRKGRPPQGRFEDNPLDNIDLKRFAQLGTFDSFLSKGRSDDRWLFVLPRLKSKPVEIFAASRLELRHGQIVALTFSEWSSLMQEALAWKHKNRATTIVGSKLRRVMKGSQSDSDAKRRVRAGRAKRV